MYKNNENTKAILCSSCLSNIEPGETYYLSPKTFYCLTCRAKQLDKPVYPVPKIPKPGTKRWKAQLKKALKVKSFKLTISPKLYNELSSEIIASMFQVDAKLTPEEKQIKRAKLFLQELKSDEKNNI
jgi:hypothetical protein